MLETNEFIVEFCVLSCPEYKFLDAWVGREVFCFPQLGLWLRASLRRSSMLKSESNVGSVIDFLDFLKLCNSRWWGYRELDWSMNFRKLITSF